MNKIRQPDEIYRQGADAIAKAFGNSVKAEIPVFIGNPTTGEMFVDSSQTTIYVHQFGSDPAGATTASASGIPKEKLTYGRPILIKQTPSGGYRFVGIDTQADEIYSNGASESSTQEPVYLNQIRWGTIHPFSALSCLVVGAFYNDTYVGDIVTGNFDGTATDTSAVAISPPSTNNRQIAVLIQVDVDTASLEYKQSPAYSASISPTRAYDNGLLPSVDENRFRVGYVFLKTGVTTISYGDIWEAPELINNGRANPQPISSYQNPLTESTTLANGLETITHGVQTESANIVRTTLGIWWDK